MSGEPLGCRGFSDSLNHRERFGIERAPELAAEHEPTWAPPTWAPIYTSISPDPMANHGTSVATAQQPAEAAITPAAALISRRSVQPRLWLSVGTLWSREIRGFYRQRSRVIAGLATPLIFWLLLGSGFANSLRESGDTGSGSLQFFFPGMVALVVLFTAIFSNISIIEDRREGFLLSVLVAPVSRMALVLGKILGATTIGFIQGLVFLPFALLLGISVELSKLPAMFAAILLTSFGLTALGFCFAWWINSVQGFHSIMNIVLMPLWLLSGAVFPAEGAARWMQWLMVVNPLSYGVTALRRLFSSGDAVSGAPLVVCFAVIFGFSVVTLAAAFHLASRTSSRNLA